MFIQQNLPYKRWSPYYDTKVLRSKEGQSDVHLILLVRWLFVGASGVAIHSLHMETCLLRHLFKGLQLEHLPWRRLSGRVIIASLFPL